MQIISILKNQLKLVIIAIAAGFYITCTSDLLAKSLVQEKRMNNQNINGTSNPSSISIPRQASVPKYQILLGNECLKKSKCYVFVYLEKRFFNKSDLIKLVTVLKKTSNNKQLLRVAIFDNRDIVEDYFRGKREWREIDRNTRAIYSYDLEEEYLKATLDGSSEREIIFQTKHK